MSEKYGRSSIVLSLLPSLSRFLNDPAVGQRCQAEPEEEDPEVEEVEEEIKRPTAKYVPNDRFMITVSKTDMGDIDDSNGIKLVDYKGEFYVADVVKGGPFYPTAIDIGDKILSVNGKKVVKDIKSLDQGLEIMNSKPKITLFVMRLEPSNPGYKWVVENYGGDMEEVPDDNGGYDDDDDLD